MHKHICVHHFALSFKHHFLKIQIFFILLAIKFFLARIFDICAAYSQKSYLRMYTQLGLSVCASYRPLDAIELPHYPGGNREGVMALALYEFLCGNRMPTLSQCMCLTASNQPIWTQPKVSRGYTEHKHQCSNLVWRMGLDMRRRRRHTHGGLA